MVLHHNYRKYIFWIRAFLIGGFSYGMLEVLWRGYTHISMIIAGGIGVCLLLLTSEAKMRFSSKCFTGAILILLIEFMTGCVVNLWLKLDVWNYSELEANLFGQICLQYFILWYLLSTCIMYAIQLIKGRALE